MIKTINPITVNVGGNRQEQRVVLMSIGQEYTEVETVHSTDDDGNYLVDSAGIPVMTEQKYRIFPISIFMKLESLEVQTYAGLNPNGIVTVGGDTYVLFQTRKATYKEETFRVLFDSMTIGDFENQKDNLFISQVDYVTQNFDSWTLERQIVTGDYFGLTANDLEVV